MKKVFAIAVAAVMSLLMVSTAQAGNETVTASTTISPQKGSLYQAYPTSANLTIRADVVVPDAETTVTPMKNTLTRLPDGLSFNPNSKVTPTCGNDKLNAQSPLGTPTAIVGACADSVVGTGTSAIYLAKFKANLLKDPILVIFNAGVSKSGNPMIKIYGFSKGTGVGILMTGTLNGRVLDIAVPVLSYDSAVANFNLNFPGEPLNRPDIGINTRGLDANYVQARCANGSQVTNAVFQLGQRDASTGAEIGPTTTIEAPQSTRNCNGQAGRARLNGLRINGPNAVRNGRQGNFRITVRNPGTAIARNVVVRTNRGGNVRIGQIAPGATRNARINVRIRGNRNSRVAVRFTVRSSNANNVSQVRRVRVR